MLNQPVAARGPEAQHRPNAAARVAVVGKHPRRAAAKAAVVAVEVAAEIRNRCSIAHRQFNWPI
jgi:hypothetical protein